MADFLGSAPKGAKLASPRAKEKEKNDEKDSASGREAANAPEAPKEPEANEKEPEAKEKEAEKPNRASGSARDALMSSGTQVLEGFRKAEFDKKGDVTKDDFVNTVKTLALPTLMEAIALEEVYESLAKDAGGNVTFEFLGKTLNPGATEAPGGEKKAEPASEPPKKKAIPKRRPKARAQSAGAKNADFHVGFETFGAVKRSHNKHAPAFGLSGKERFKPLPRDARGTTQELGPGCYKGAQTIQKGVTSISPPAFGSKIERDLHSHMKKVTKGSCTPVAVGPGAYPPLPPPRE